jgi:hypothetical protein
MRLPGFSAENSLSSLHVSYKTTGTDARPSAGGRVLPQFWRCSGDYCCNEYGYCIRSGHYLM